MRPRPCLVAVLIAFVPGTWVGIGGTPALAAPSPALTPTGIGRLAFGDTEREAVSRLTRLFGPPTGRGINTGCGARFTEIVWGDLAAEFRGHVFSGYRYINGGYPLTTPGSPRTTLRPARAVPRLATRQRITLGSTLARTQAAYPGLRRTGADSWGAKGFTFVDGAKRHPVSPSSRIIEIKTHTCGDF